MPDNLATGVDRPNLYDPKINRVYVELDAHYGCLDLENLAVQVEGVGDDHGVGEHSAGPCSGG